MSIPEDTVYTSMNLSIQISVDSMQAFQQELMSTEL